MTLNRQALSCFLLAALLFTSCARRTINLENILKQDDFLYKIATDSTYEVQIIYTQVDKRKKKFHTQRFQVNDKKYFYPASTVKMPVAILALQQLKSIQDQGVPLLQSDAMLTAQLNDRLLPAFQDDTQDSGKPSIERYIQKIFAVSDNDAYNRLLEWLGRDYINEEMEKKGIRHGSVIRHRLSIPGLTENDHATFNNVRFFQNKKMIYDKPIATSLKEWKHSATGTLKGKGYFNNSDSLITAPFDFGLKNFYCLRDMEGTLQRIIFPDFFLPEERFTLKEEDYTFLKKCMSDLPSAYHFYSDTTVYYDSYVKFLMFGDKKDPIPPYIKIYNKVGTAYGYLIDCAYIEDQQAGVGFFLTAMIHVNTDGIFNDNKYEYDSIGLPFLARLGSAVYQAERKAVTGK